MDAISKTQYSDTIDITYVKKDGTIVSDDDVLKALASKDPLSPDRFEPDRFEPDRFKTSSELAMVRKKINDTESLFLDELGAIRNTNRKGSEFLVKMAAHLRELDEAKQGDVSKSDISKLILKAREYYSKMPETDENEFLYRTVLYDIANLLKDT